MDGCQKHLPLLSDPKWYKQTQYGLAHRNEPMQFVENIRCYFDLLVWLTEENQIKDNVMADEKIQNTDQTAEITLVLPY